MGQSSHVFSSRPRLESDPLEPVLRANLKSVAAAAHVSINTVSDIVNRGCYSLYDKKTVERVRAASANLNYRPNRSAQAMRRNKTQIVGYVTWTTGNKFIANLQGYIFLVGLTHYLAKHEYHVTLIELSELTTDESGQIPLILRSHFCDALVLHEGVWGDFIKWEKELKTPLLWWDAGLFNQTGCLNRDEKKVGQVLCEELINRGHRRPAYVFNNKAYRRYQENRDKPAESFQRRVESPTEINIPSHYSERDRFAGYLSALKKAALKPLLVHGDTVNEIAASMEITRPDALIIGGARYDTLSLAAAQLGLKIPADISLASCDVETNFRDPLEMRAGGIRYDRHTAGEIAGEMILKMLINPEKQVPSRTIFDGFEPGNTILTRS
jgi:DNA-binding LacI/PurR family transcriptional regulator